ncbi:MAG: hypothetical protein CMB52_01045 [Euryarchaeota archaeon]|nr:hypothetical protein [Euryarchaeota archaeon]
MSAMVRVFSVLPFATGLICMLLVAISLFGFASGTIDDEIPAIPCPTPQEGCPTGMSDADLDVPSAFIMLDVKLEIKMELDDDSWIGVVDSKYAETCPPGESGLTDCSASDYEFLAGGPDHEGPIHLSLEPGSLRFVTGGDEGSTQLQENAIETTWSVHLATWIEVLLTAGGVVLCLSGVHMAFPSLTKRKD